MNEKYIEQQLIKAVKKRNGLALKLYSPSYIGIPDRLVLIAFGHIGFVEVKAPKKMPRPIQLKRHEELRKKEEIEKILDEIEGGRKDGISTT